MKQYGLKKEDFSVINEYGAKGGSHIHVEFKKPEFLDKVRDEYQANIAKATTTPTDKKDDKGNTNTTQTSQVAPGQQNNQQPVAGSVNSNVAVVSIAKPEWFEEAMKNSSAQQNRMVIDLGSKFDNMYNLLKKKLG